MRFKNDLALRLATKHNQTDIVCLLLQNGSINCKARENEALYNVVRNGNLDLLKQLFRFVNLESRRHFALHLSIKNKHWHIFDFLIATVYKNHTPADVGKLIHDRENRSGWADKQIQRKVQPYLIAHFIQRSETFNMETFPKYDWSTFAGPWQSMCKTKTIIGQKARAIVLQEQNKFLHNVYQVYADRIGTFFISCPRNALKVVTVKPLLQRLCTKWNPEKVYQIAGVELISPFGFALKKCLKRTCAKQLYKTLTRPAKALLLGLAQLELPTLLLLEIFSKIHEPIGNCVEFETVYNICNVAKSRQK